MASDDPIVGDSEQQPQNTGPLAGKFGLALSLALIATAGYLTYRAFTEPGEMHAEPAEIIFMCSETKKDFKHIPQMGEKWPVLSPFTKRNTGYPVERCYWTKDNKQKSKPTYLILNEHLGIKGETICPDCGRIVVGHNPMPPSDTPMASELETPTTLSKEKPPQI